MFFGNMQSFYRRNSLYNQSSSQGSQTKSHKEHSKRAKLLKKNEIREDDDDKHPKHNSTARRRSFSISREYENEEHLENFNDTKIPVIKIGLYEAEPTKPSFNILKEKEKALWFNSCPESDNTERLGPNRNNIIVESLETERRQSQGDCIN